MTEKTLKHKILTKDQQGKKYAMNIRLVSLIK